MEESENDIGRLTEGGWFCKKDGYHCKEFSDDETKKISITKRASPGDKQS